MFYSLLTADEVAERARVHPETLRRLIREGRGPSPTRVGGKLFVREDLLRAWLDANTGFAPVAQEQAA